MKKNRTTSEQVILILTWTVAIVIILDVVFILFFVLVRPTIDLSTAARGIGDIINVLVGALVGYLAGTKSKGDTDSRDPDPPQPPTTD